jgi:hypothetical protein
VRTNKSVLLTLALGVGLISVAGSASAQNYYYRPPLGGTANTTPAIRYSNPYTGQAVYYTSAAAGYAVYGGVSMYRGSVNGAVTGITGLYNNTGHAYNAWQARSHYVAPPPPRYYYPARR